jgi:hypothetical protein
MRSIRLLALWFGIALIAGCASHGGNPGFARSFTSVSSGATRGQVRGELGEPDRRVSGHVSAADDQPPGAMELVQTLPPGTPWEAWIYHRGQDVYYIYFASGSNQPKEQWRVIARRTVLRRT